MRFHGRSVLRVGYVGPWLIPAILLLTSPAVGESYRNADFIKFSVAGGAALIEVSAPWCAPCQLQARALRVILAQPAFASVRIFNVDYDSQKEALRRFDAKLPTTLVLMKAGGEVGRSVGEIRQDRLEWLLRNRMGDAERAWP